MMDIQKLKRFLSKDFNNAILSIRKKDNQIIPHLTLKEKSKLNGKLIDIYSENIKKLRNNPLKLCDYMLDNFLSNHTVIGIKYFTHNQYHPNKTCFDIITTDGVFTIALSDVNINELFPNFIKRVEFAKREGVLKTIFEEKSSYKKHFFLALSFSSYDITTSLGYSNYHILSFLKNNKLIIPTYERKFVINMIQDILKLHNVTDTCCYEREIMRIENLLDEIKEDKNNSFLSHLKLREFSINNIIFEFYDDERALIQIELIKEAIKGLEQEFKYHTFSEIINEPIKQLIIKKYYK